MNSLRRLPARLRRLWSGSIRRRLILGIGALLAVVMSALVADLAKRQVDYLHRESEREAKALAQTLAANSVSWVLATDLAGLQEVIQVVKNYPDVRYAMILARDGKVLAHSDPRMQGRYARDPVSELLLRAPLVTQLLLSTSSLVDVAAPIQANGAPVGWARVSLSQDAIYGNLRAIVRNGVIYATIAIALGALLAVLITRGLTRDLARLVEVTRRVSGGERGVQSGLAREDELGALSSAFDHMTLDLDRASQALREREEYIGKLVDKSPLAMIVSSGREQRIHLVNEKFTALFGYTIEEMPDIAHWWPLAYPQEKYREDVKAIWTERVARAIESKGEIEPVEATVRCKDGSLRHVEIRLSSIGERHLVTFTDLTQRKRAEHDALEQFKLAEAFFRHSVSCLVILDRSFNFVRVNEAYARACRKEIAEFAGRNHFEMYPSDARAIFEEVVRTKSPFTTFTRAFKYPDQPERGITYWDWTLAPILDQQGEVEYLVFSLQEVTERKQAEEEQRTAALYARSLIEANLDPLVTISAQGKITDVNKATEDVTGLARERLAGTDFADYFTEADKARAGYREVLTTGYVRDYPLTIRHTSGRTTDVLYNATVYRNEAGELQGVFAAARDITEKKRAERALHKVNRALKTTSECNTTLIYATDEIQLLNDMCRIIVDTGGYRLAWVGYFEHDAQRTVRPMAQRGHESGRMEDADLTWVDSEPGGPLGTAIRAGQIQVVQDVSVDPRFEPWRANAARLGYGSMLIAPLVSASETIGALSICSGDTNAFDEGEIALLSELAGDMAFGIVTLRTRGAQQQSAVRLQRSMEATIQVIAGTVEMRDPYTAGHQRRVAELATAIARELGLPEERVHGVNLAGVVHDLGKIHIPAEILSKPGKLSSIEFELIKSHPETGYVILKDVDFPWQIAQIVYQHHERLDGSGYPRGLKAEEILLEARILAVADVVEAMASHRPYRAALGIDLALEEIGANAGKRYDADVARACITLFREKGFAFKV